MTGVEVAAAMVFAWAVRKARRVGGKADGIVDETIEQLGDRAHGAVMERLRGRPAVELAQAEAEQALPVLVPEVRTGLEHAIAEAVQVDPSFRERLEELADVVQRARGGAPLASVANTSVSGNTVTGPLAVGASVSGNTFSNDTTHTTNTFNDKTVVSNGSDAELHITF